MPQQVDPFIPVSRTPRQPAHRRPIATPQKTQTRLQGQYGHHLFRKSGDKLAQVQHAPQPHYLHHSGSVDGLRAAQTAPQHGKLRPVVPQRHHTAHTTPAQAQNTPAAALPAKREQPSRFRRFLRKLHTPFFVLAFIVVGLVAQSLLYGELLVIAYGVYALIWRVASRTTFLLALLAVVCIAVLLAAHRDPSFASNFAVYAFLLMIIGTISLGREIRRAN